MDAINMEVKIKIGDEMIDAKIVMMNGDMIVSPKVVKFEPKKGDVIVSGGDTRFVAIFEKMKDEYSFYYYALLVLGVDRRPQLNSWASFLNVLPATEEEKKLLFDKLAEEGYSWDAERKELVKLKWKPQDHEKVYVAGFTFYGDNPFCAFEDTAYSGSMQWRAVFKRGWYFKTEQKCQEFCNRLNNAISQVKP